MSPGPGPGPGVCDVDLLLQPSVCGCLVLSPFCSFLVFHFPILPPPPPPPFVFLPAGVSCSLCTPGHRCIPQPVTSMPQDHGPGLLSLPNLLLWLLCSPPRHNTRQSVLHSPPSDSKEIDRSRARIRHSEGGDVPPKYFVVTNNQLLRVKYLLVYSQKQPKR